MPSLVRCCATLSLLIAAAACQSIAELPVPDPHGPDFVGPAPTLVTDQASYVAIGDSSQATHRTYRFRLVTMLENPSDQQLYVATCSGLHVPTYGLLGARQSAYSPMYACSGGQPGMPLPAHSIRTDTLDIIGPTAFDGHTGVGEGDIDGTLNLTYAVATCPVPERCDHVQAVVAQAFTVHAVAQ